MARPDSKTKAYTQAYADYYSLIYSMVYAKIGDADTTHDLCQEVFIRYYMKFDEVDNHRRWLFAAVKYVLLEHYRTRKASQVDIDLVMEDIKMSFVNGFRDTRVMIEEALESLDNFGDEKNRILFDLIALYNYSYKEAGAHLGLSERQARYQYSLVVDKLMDHFRTKGVKGLEDLL